uniref:Uncharacterized protein n=1 Tax=Trichuris muris TaxID=70415 RepID=A0A5S6QLH7_TRIMR
MKKLGVTVVFSSQGNLRSILRTDIPRRPPEFDPGVIYQVVCGCGARYIGIRCLTNETVINLCGDFKDIKGVEK